MEELIIEDENCRISRIITVLKQSPVLGELDGKLLSLALTLGNPHSLKDAVHRNVILFGTMPPTEGLVKLLTEWRSRETNNAKLTTFLEALETDGLHDFAQRLRDHFKGTENSRASRMGDPANEDFSALAKSIKQHIAMNLPELLELVHWNAALIARLQAQDIIGKADVAELDSVVNSYDKTRKLFQFIDQRITAKNVYIYEQVIMAFEGVNQSGVSDKLRRAYQR